MDGRRFLAADGKVCFGGATNLPLETQGKKLFFTSQFVVVKSNLRSSFYINLLSLDFKILKS